jgi:hypothetical protein
MFAAHPLSIPLNTPHHNYFEKIIDQVLTRRKITVDPKMTINKNASAKGQQTKVEPVLASGAAVGKKNVGEGRAA